MKLFVCYAHKDIKKAQRLVNALQRAEHTVWFDEELQAGKWKEQLLVSIRDCDAFIYALTPNSVKSEWCLWEFVQAIESGKPIVPVMLEEAELPIVLNEYQYVDLKTGFRRKNIRGLQKNLSDLAIQIPKEKAPQVPDDPRGKPSRADVRQHVTIRGDVSGTVSVVGYIEQQILGRQHRNWTVPVILGLLLTSIGTIAAILAVLPEPDRNHVLYQARLVDPSETPTLTPSVTFTPAPTRTNTPIPTLTPTPSLSEFDIGIAVTYFAIPADDSVDPREADTLVEQIKGRVILELQDFRDEVGLTIGFLEPSVIGRIAGNTRSEREKHARIIADKYGADIVLYGDISKNSKGLLEVQPEFYVLPERFTEALEMTGAFRLGRKIEVEGRLSRVQNVMRINRPLSSRTAAVAQIFAGLIYYFIEDYDAALSAFKAAAQLPGWEDTEGREVLHVLLGNTYIKMSSVAAQHTSLDSARINLNLAISEYEEAIELAPDYSRPYVGLASAYYLWWNVDAQETNDPELSFLEKALEYLMQARDAINESEEIGIQTKELFIRLQIDYAIWAYHPTELDPDELDRIYDDLQDTANQIIRRYDDGGNPSVQELASETYALLGLTASDLSSCEEAVDYYQQALGLSTLPRRRMYFYGWMADCYVNLNQRELASQAYGNALELAETLHDVPHQLKKYYEDSLVETRGRG